MIFQHPDYVQSFDKDRLVLADDLRCEFLKRIPSGVAYFGVQSRHFQSGLLPIGAALDLARQTTLKSFVCEAPTMRVISVQAGAMDGVFFRRYG